MEEGNLQASATFFATVSQVLLSLECRHSVHDILWHAHHPKSIY